MAQYTSIIQIGERGILSVRSRKGHMTRSDMAEYLSAIDGEDGLSVRFDFIDLYEDVGESTGPEVVYAWDQSCWVPFEQHSRNQKDRGPDHKVEVSQNFDGPWNEMTVQEFDEFLDHLLDKGEQTFVDPTNGVIRFVRVFGSRRFAISSQAAIHGEDAENRFELAEIDNPDCMDPYKMYSDNSFAAIFSDI
jgi:hypothetical protein